MTEDAVAAARKRVLTLPHDSAEIDEIAALLADDGLRELLREYAYGAVEGRVQALSSRGTLRFTLYDTLHDQAVSCYLDDSLSPADRQQIMRDVWGRLAIVEGFVKRDHRSGRPRSVRRVRNVTVLPEPAMFKYQDARGSWPVSRDQLSPEDAINRVRDRDAG